MSSGLPEPDRPEIEASLAELERELDAARSDATASFHAAMRGYGRVCIRLDQLKRRVKDRPPVRRPEDT